MFSSGPNYTKLKTHLRLALNRLKLIEKKKTELAQKARKEIADYLMTGKIERARIRVEHIIREDYLVEAMEVVEMYCDLLLTRFGLVTQMKELDEGIAEAIYSLVWVAPRLQTDIQELKIIADLFISKYGKEFAEQARTATGNHKVSEKLMHKLAIQAPPKLLVEKYLVEIAKIYNIEYEPDHQVMKDDTRPIGMDGFLIDLSDKNNLAGAVQPPQPGFICFPQPPVLPSMPEPPSNIPFNYPPFGSGATAPSFPYNIPPTGQSEEQKSLNIDPGFNQKNIKPQPPQPQPRTKPPNESTNNTSPTMPFLPNVPSDLPDVPTDKKDDDEIDFDDLSRRFQELKKKK